MPTTILTPAVCSQEHERPWGTAVPNSELLPATNENPSYAEIRMGLRHVTILAFRARLQMVRSAQVILRCSVAAKCQNVISRYTSKFNFTYGLPYADFRQTRQSSTKLYADIFFSNASTCPLWTSWSPGCDRSVTDF
jgi:hypothetical protein